MRYTDEGHKVASIIERFRAEAVGYSDAPDERRSVLSNMLGLLHSDTAAQITDLLYFSSEIYKIYAAKREWGRLREYMDNADIAYLQDWASTVESAVDAAVGRVDSLLVEHYRRILDLCDNGRSRGSQAKTVVDWDAFRKLVKGCTEAEGDTSG